MDDLFNFTVLKEKSFTNKDNNVVSVKLSKTLDPIDLVEVEKYQVFVGEKHGFTIPKEDAITLSKIILELSKPEPKKDWQLVSGSELRQGDIIEVDELWYTISSKEPVSETAFRLRITNEYGTDTFATVSREKVEIKRKTHKGI
jgi:hypothetical protein